ncbi:Type II secretion system protein N [Sphingobium herbicidovorans NBRC 16415]|uniref:Type II secretion system protein N n=1 Tax=Sphingobium herbicidovorans (strain ATCC 700291 / DSM 11019 / CCUG 56400 / KCTC 2939 / LMG 18315 / NBRC 16415 / MH) TaxID=1219045 RepID=A0A086P898_SPHHM|nr:type II secretion system protein N [Sphingobium herbicidovorans]KFG89616.1 Type II secretion system protein N [Sphingobium herbicidovorans NBRC 16415]
MKSLQLSGRARAVLILLFLFGLIAFMPMRIALGLTGLERVGVSARDVRGSLWSGRIDQLMLGTIPVGAVRAGLSPISLLMGRARIDIWRRRGAADDLSGALTVGFNRIGIDDVTGAVPLGRSFAPLPIGSLVMEDVTAYFSGDRCGHAEGRVRAQLAGQFPGLNLSQGLSGTASCDGDALLLPLVSQSGLEKISLRIWRSGRYVAEMRVETADAGLGAALAKAGFSDAGGAQLLKVEGTL